MPGFSISAVATGNWRGNWRGAGLLMRQGRSETGPYQTPMEDGMRHFHAFYRSIIEPHL